MNRIADVGNPWLDAGIVPFSTLQYRANPEFWNKWYPAHWISESFPGQFRNWFYSLLAMATVVAERPPFLQNFGYATLLAEDGRPMHKSWGNAIEFNEAADKMGVDVMRWLYCAHKPENDLLFGFTRGDEVRRQFLIPLWNAYSFLATYARLDNWSPDGSSGFDPFNPEGPTPRSDNLLDRWVLARLNQVVVDVTQDLEASDIYAASQTVEVFLDDLTNWYIRRSRRRFWKSQHDADKNTAYSTLYHVMVKLGRLLAPFTPFVTEAMYQNLVRQVRPGALESIHHTNWPEVDRSAINQKLITDMALARRIASLGLGARASANLKVRQPLGKVLVHSGGEHSLDQLLVEIVIDELNVKELEFVEKEGTLVTYKILPDNKLLGPRLGARFPKVKNALATVNVAEVVAKIRSGAPVSLTVDGEPVELAANELLIQTQPATGLVVMADKGMTVGIDTAITPDLRSEGLARELVRRIQDMRKNAGFNISDRITTYYQAGDELGQVMQSWEDYLKAETLTTSLVSVPPPASAYVEEHKVDAMVIVIGVMQNR